MSRKLTIAFLVLYIVLINTYAKADEQIRSTSLKEVVFNNEHSVRKDFVNEQNTITYAADLGYATIKTTYSENSQTEEYFDANGKPAKQRLGHYALFREYDEKGRNWRSTFWGIDKQPVLTGNGYASIIREFYDNNNVKTEHYLDEQGDSINTIAYGYGCFKEYDINNRNNVLIYLGVDGKPTVTGQGFAIVRRVFYDDGESIGKVKEEFYYNSNDEPTKLMYGQSGLYKEYDQYGRVVVLTYLDEKGNPIVTKAGYTTIKRAYYEDDSIKSDMYFDKNWKPISLSEGQYGVLYIDGKTIYLDKNGKEQINVKQILYNNEWVVILIVICVVIASCLAGRRINVLFLALYCFAIAYMTLMHRITTVPEYYDILLSVYGKWVIKSIMTKGTLNNILLFLPLGTILYRLNPKICIIFVPVLLSVLIELLQYYYKMGLCELNDVISNGLGGFLGYAIGSGFTKVIHIIKKYLYQKQHNRLYDNVL